MQKYIQQVNNIIEAFEIKGDKSKFRSKMLETLKADEHCFYITCDDLRSEEDVFIIKEILNLSSKIILLIRNEEKFSLLLKNYKNQIVFYDVSQLQYALSSDIHIFLYDKNLLQILYRFHKVFNVVHPKEYPSENIDNIQALWGSEKLRFYFGEDAPKIKTFNDLFYYYFKDFMSTEEIEQAVQALSKKRFLLFVKYMEKNRKLIDRMFELSHLAYEYELLIKNNNSKNDVTKSFIEGIK